MSRNFLAQTLRPLFHREDRTCITSLDFVPGVCYEHNLNNALLFSTIVIIIVTANLTKDPRVERDVSAVTSKEVKCGSCRVIPILLGDIDDLPIQLDPITSITYDTSQSDCDDLLSNGLKKAFQFQEQHKSGSVTNCSGIAPDGTSGSYGNAERVTHEEVQISNGSDTLPRATEISDSAPDQQSAHLLASSDKPRNLNSYGTRPFQLELFRVFRSGWGDAMRTALLMKPGYIFAVLRIFFGALLTGLCLLAFVADHVSSDSDPTVISLSACINQLLRPLAMFIFASELCRYMGNVQHVCTKELLGFNEAEVRQIGNHLVGESQMDRNVQTPCEMFKHLHCFLRSVAHVNVITAWLYPVTMTILLWQQGYYDRQIRQGSRGNQSWAYVYILQDIVVLNLMQGFSRTLIGLHHYERNLLVEAYKMERKSESDGRCEQIRSAAAMVRERTNSRNKKALGLCAIIALLSITAAVYNNIHASGSLTEVRGPYACLVAWLIVLEALMNCPKRHMKFTAVATNAMAIIVFVAMQLEAGRLPSF